MSGRRAFDGIRVGGSLDEDTDDPKASQGDGCRGRRQRGRSTRVLAGARLMATIIRSSLDGTLNEVVTGRQVAKQIALGRARGSGFVCGSLDEEDGLIIYERSHTGARIAPIRFWRYSPARCCPSGTPSSAPETTSNASLDRPAQNNEMEGPTMNENMPHSDEPRPSAVGLLWGSDPENRGRALNDLMRALGTSHRLAGTTTVPGSTDPFTREDRAVPYVIDFHQGNGWSWIAREVPPARPPVISRPAVKQAPVEPASGESCPCLDGGLFLLG